MAMGPEEERDSLLQQLASARETLGEMSALAARVKNIQVRELEEALAESDVDEAKQEELEQTLERGREELGALSAEGTSWKVSELRSLKLMVRRNYFDDDREARLEEQVEASRAELAELSSAAASWKEEQHQKVLGMMEDDCSAAEREQLEMDADVTQKEADELILVYSSLSVEDMQKELESGTVDDESLADLLDELRQHQMAAGEAGARLARFKEGVIDTLQEQLAASDDPAEDAKIVAKLEVTKSELAVASLQAAMWYVSLMNELQERLKIISSPEVHQATREELDLVKLEFSNVSMEAVKLQAREIEEIRLVLDRSDITAAKRNSLEKRLRKLELEFGEMNFAAAKCKVEEVGELEAALNNDELEGNDRTNFAWDLEEARRELSYLAVAAVRWQEERVAQSSIEDFVLVNDLGELSLAAAKVKAGDVEALGARLKECPDEEREEWQARLDQAMSDLGEVSSVAATSRFNRVEELKAMLERDLSETDRERLEQELAQTELELGALSCEGSKWKARQLAALIAEHRANLNDPRKDLQLEANIAKQQQSLGILSSCGSAWMGQQVMHASNILAIYALPCLSAH